MTETGGRGRPQFYRGRSGAGFSPVAPTASSALAAEPTGCCGAATARNRPPPPAEPPAPPPPGCRQRKSALATPPFRRAKKLRSGRWCCSSTTTTGAGAAPLSVAALRRCSISARFTGKSEGQITADGFASGKIRRERGSPETARVVFDYEKRLLRGQGTGTVRRAPHVRDLDCAVLFLDAEDRPRDAQRGHLQRMEMSIAGGGAVKRT